MESVGQAPIARVMQTPAAAQLLARLRARYGALMFFQSGGCCDGSAPMCYQAGEFPVGDQDVYLGSLDGTPFYMGGDQFDYWRHTQLIIDVVDGMGGMFSLDNGTGKRFLTRSRLFSDADHQALEGVALRRGLQVEDGMRHGDDADAGFNGGVSGVHS